MSGAVTLERTPRTAWITLDRPAAKNAITGPMVQSLQKILTDLRHDDSAEVVVIRGAGTDFCAGSDMGDLASVLSSSGPERAASFERAMREKIQPLVRSLLDLPQPVVASARGHAIGLGVTFLLAADLVVLSETARITVPQVRLGHTVDHGESWLLPRRIGLSKAMQLCLLGERMPAVDAERFGLANWVTPEDELERRTEKVIAGLLAVAPIPLVRTKQLLTASAGADLDTQLGAEVSSASSCAGTADFVEAISAQVERRTPKYSRT